jgi:hypothetical protein
VLFEATVFESVFFRRDDYSAYLDLTHQFAELLDNEKLSLLKKISFA